MELRIKKYGSMDGEGVWLDGEPLFWKKGLPVKAWLSALYRHLEIDYPKFFKMDLLSKAGLLGSEMLLRGGQAERGMALIAANRSSSLENDRDYQQTIGTPYFPSPSVFVYTLPNIVLGEIAIRHQLHGENIFLLQERFNPAQLVECVESSALHAGWRQAMVGWIEVTQEVCNVLLMLVGRPENGEDEDKGGKFDVSTIKRLKNERTGGRTESKNY